MPDLQTINKKLDKLLEQTRKPAPLTVDEACVYLKIKKSSLYKLTSARVIPYYKPNGQQIYFDITDLEKYVYSHKVESEDDIRAKITS